MAERYLSKDYSSSGMTYFGVKGWRNIIYRKAYGSTPQQPEEFFQTSFDVHQGFPRLPVLFTIILGGHLARNCDHVRILSMVTGGQRKKWHFVADWISPTKSAPSKML